MSRLLLFADRTVRAGGVAAVAALTLTACGGSSSDAAGTAPTNANSRTATVTITSADGCQVSATTFPAGALTFDISNKDATAVSEVELDSGDRIVGEKENLPPGFSGTFSVDVDGGTYSLYCPGAKVENIPITVTGHTTAASGDSVEALLKTGTDDYAKYVTTQAGYLVSSVKVLRSGIAGGNLAAAQAAYDKARPFYEKIEPVAESFTVGKNNLDADIDARANDVPAADWKGFHPIEKGLFQDKSTKGLSSLAAGLVGNVEKLQKLTNGLTYQPYELANGAQELLDEVAASKITGEEERYSHIDLLDIQANVEGAEQAFADLQPALTKIDASLTKTIAAYFTSLDNLLNTYRTGSNPSGFEYYSALSQADKRQLAAAVKAVQEPLSQVASKVAKV
ncbi:MAG TPA: iron uptake system protein EfeO [Mycobacteriales bacterium]|nr:iron uptake system protein EfeO [Mycobacteriales bacterium]